MKSRKGSLGELKAEKGLFKTLQLERLWPEAK
jgi:hypothetical protein